MTDAGASRGRRPEEAPGRCGAGPFPCNPGGRLPCTNGPLWAELTVLGVLF